MQLQEPAFGILYRAGIENCKIDERLASAEHYAYDVIEVHVPST